MLINCLVLYVAGSVDKFITALTNIITEYVFWVITVKIYKSKKYVVTRHQTVFDANKQGNAKLDVLQCSNNLGIIMVRKGPVMTSITNAFILVFEDLAC